MFEGEIMDEPRKHTKDHELRCACVVRVCSWTEIAPGRW